MTTTDSTSVAYPVVDGLSISVDDGVLTVLIDRPASLNSLNLPVLGGIADAFDAAATDPAVKVIKLGGTGRGFSSGAGLDDDTQSSRGTTPTAIIDQANRAVRAIVDVPHPVVAVVHGPAAGVGVSLALACDLVIASDAAYFLLAFTKIGLMPDGGASALVAASIGRHRAMAMALLAERLPAQAAFDAGLVTAVHPAADFDAEVALVVARLLAGPVVAYAKSKAAINDATLTELDAAFARERDGQGHLLQAHDLREGILAFHQRRPPTFTDR